MADKTKTSTAIKFTIILLILAVVFLVLSIVSANLSVSRTVNAIDTIGTVEFSNDSKGKIDLALKYYGELDTNLSLQSKVTNADELTAAKFEYVRLAIKNAYLADKNGGDEATIKEYIELARKSFDEYCSTGKCKNVSNYDDLTSLESKYSDGGADASQNTGSPEPAEEIELC